jgi:hypothetical protein
VAAALAEQGFEVPVDLQPAEVWPVAEAYRRAFKVLSASRAYGEHGPQPIEYEAIAKYAEKNGFDASFVELEEFVQLIQEQDAEHLKQVAKRMKRTTKEPHK